MKEISKFYKLIGLLVVMGLLFAALPIGQAQAETGTTIPVSVLDPSWTAPGGGGVYAAYYSPSSAYPAIAPGSTALFGGREAGIIKAGINKDVTTGHYLDEGILAFQVNSVPTSTFALQALSYEVQNETGINPVWVRIRIVGGTTFQHVPAFYGVGGGYHVIDAAAGQWQLMDTNGNATGPMMTLTQLAAAYPAALVDRVYLTLGQGDSYNVSEGIGTVGWVDKVVIHTTTYDFVVVPQVVLCTTDCFVAPTGADTNLGNLDTPFLTIQKAIDTVSVGGMVHVAAGEYRLPIAKELNRPVSIIGPTTGEAKVVGGGGSSNTIFKITSSDVAIQSLSFTLAVAPTAADAIIFAPDGAKTNINILNNKIYVDPQPGAMSSWFGQAIYLGRFITSSHVNGNTIYNTRSGLVVYYSSALEIKDNVIYNTKGGIMNYTSDTAAANNRVMSGNSWGTVHNEWDIVWNSAVYDMDMNIYVLQLSAANSDGYVFSGVSTLSPKESLKSNRSHVFVNASTGTATVRYDNGNINVPYAKIQDGIDAVVPGGKVIVAAGTYEENLIINKELTLRGPNANKAGNAEDRAAEAVIKNTKTMSEKGIGVKITSKNVTVEGFTIEGGETGYRGIYGGNAYNEPTNINVTVQNNRLVKFGWYDVDGSYGRGIAFDNYLGTSYVYGIQIKNNFVKYAYGGIVLGVNAYADVSNNQVESCFYGLHFVQFNKPLPAEMVNDYTLHNNQITIDNDYGWNVNTGMAHADLNYEKGSMGIYFNIIGSGVTAIAKDNTITASADSLNIHAGINVNSLNGGYVKLIDNTINNVGSGIRVWGTQTSGQDTNIDPYVSQNLQILGGTINGGKYGINITDWYWLPGFDESPTRPSDMIGTQNRVFLNGNLQIFSTTKIRIFNDPIGTHPVTVILGDLVTNVNFNSATDVVKVNADLPSTGMIIIRKYGDAALAVADTYTVAEEGVLNVGAPGVLSNDFYFNPASLTAIKVSDPTHGTLTLNADGSFIYTPTANYNGPDSFTYKAYSGSADSNIATVSITIIAVNDAPVAQDQTVTTAEDTAATITLVATDVDGDGLTYIIVTPPAHGVAEVVGNVVIYTPTANYNGPDSFTFKANDGSADSNTATVTITVTPEKDNPLAVDDFYQTNQDTQLLVSAADGVLKNDTDVDLNNRTVALSTNVTHGVLTLYVDGSFIYMPNLGFYGNDTFIYELVTYPALTVVDGWTDRATVTITVNENSIKIYLPIILR
jgi:VCBS repeat-containing protein